MSYDPTKPTSAIITPSLNAQPGYGVALDRVIDYLWSSGRIFGFALTEVGDGTVNIASGVAMLRSGDSTNPYLDPLYACNIAAVNALALTNNATNFIYADYNSGSPTVAVTTDITSIGALSKVVLYVVTRIGTDLDWFAIGSYQSNFMAKYAKKKYVQNAGVEYGSGAVSSEVDTRKLAITAGNFYSANELLSTPVFNSNVADTFTLIYRSGASTWTRTAGQTQLGNTQYNRLSDNTLQTLGNNNYGVYWVFWVLDNPSRLVVVYGQGDYASHADAEAAGIPTSLPPEVMPYSNGVLIAKILFLKSATNFHDVQNPFSVAFSSSVATTHNGLAQLQGGVIDEYYHLTSAEYTRFQFGDTSQSLSATGNITAGNVKFTGSTASQTLTLPDAATYRKVFVRNAASVSVTLARSGADTIEGDQSLVLNPGESAMLIAVGTDWTVFN